VVKKVFSKCSLDEAERNPGLDPGRKIPDSALLHPGYVLALFESRHHPIFVFRVFVFNHKMVFSVLSVSLW
jgi:hypothetical protein